MKYSSDVISRSKIHKRLDLGFSGLGKFIWISQSLVMFSSSGFFFVSGFAPDLDRCVKSSTERNQEQIWGTNSSSEEQEHCFIVTVPVLILLFVECGSTTQLLLALQV